MVSITYNGYNIPHNLGKFHYTENEKTLAVSIDFLVTSSSSGGLESTCDSIREKLTEINKNFSLTLGGSTEFNLSHSSNTGFNARPVLSKIADELSTGISRHYRWDCSVGLPFAQSPYNYRREASISIQYAPSRQRLVSFHVTYTAGGSYSALDNYNVYAKLWAASVLSSLGGTYELLAEIPSYEQENKIASSSLTYKEILSNQAAAGLDDTAFVDMQCSYSLSIAQSYGKQFIGAYPVMTPPISLSLFYSTTISKDIVATDASFDTQYTTKIRPWLIAHAETVLVISGYSSGGASSYILQHEQKTFNVHTYTISGQLQILCPRTNNVVAAYDEVLHISRKSGQNFRKLWNGKDHAFSFWNVGKTWILNRSIVISRLGEPPVEPTEYAGSEFGGTGRWIPLENSTSYSMSEVGAITVAVGLTQNTMHSKTFKSSYLYAEEIDEQVME